MRSITAAFAAQTTNATSTAIPGASNNSGCIVQATITGTGTVSATVTLYGNTTNATTGGIALGSAISLSGTNSATGSAVDTQGWPWYYVVITSISGTNAAINVNVGI